MVVASEELWIPPWRDFTRSPTASPSESSSSPSLGPSRSPFSSPSNSPSKSPTSGPTQAPTPRFITSYPSWFPTDVPVQVNTPQQPSSEPTLALPTEFTSPFDNGIINSTTYDYGEIETSCTILPTVGTFVTEVFDFEYSIYLVDEGDLDVDNLQEIIRSLVPSVHDNIVDMGMNCRNLSISATHSLVGLSSFVGDSNNPEEIIPGRDTVGARCSIAEDDENVLANATSCYQAWGKLQATMWFSPRRRSRKVQQTSNSATPFGDREAFNEFASLMDEAFQSLTMSNDTVPSVLQATFQGFVNVNGFDGTVMEYPQDLGVSPTAALMGSSYAAAANGGSINVTFGTIVIVASVLALSFVVLFVVMRRRRSHRAYLEHAKCVDELYMDSKDDAESNPDIVDDASLFGEEQPLPKEYEVTMESADHDYRTCANPTCSICQQQKRPVFIETTKDQSFLDSAQYNF